MDAIKNTQNSTQTKQKSAKKLTERVEMKKILNCSVEKWHSRVMAEMVRSSNSTGNQQETAQCKTKALETIHSATLP